ncbi:agmatinase family protein [Sorangium sp. So ce542]|uniref:agmatinase family protein n=1 Tax=Sorangium sp. So ce542 TaxID=3133316 RepID=UPI003F5DECB1
MSSSPLGFDPNGPAVGHGIYGLPHTAEDARVVLIPVPWEPTVSYRRGAAKGPAAILRASRQIDLFDLHTGRPYEQGIAMLDVDPDIVRWNAEACAAAEPVIAAQGEVAGDRDLEARLAAVNALSGRLNERVAEIAKRWMERGKLVGLVGGDHSAPYGTIAAHAERYPGMGILHVDAHADLRDAYEGFTDSHASIMRNVATRHPKISRIVQVGLRDMSEDELRFIRESNGRVVAHVDAAIADRLFEGEPFHLIADAIVEDLPDDVYVTFDIDGLDPTLCPSTGTPVPGGLSFQQAVALIGRIHRSGRRIVGFDLNEVAPKDDHDEWDGNVGARLLYKLIGFTLLSQDNAQNPNHR